LDRWWRGGQRRLDGMVDRLLAVMGDGVLDGMAEEILDGMMDRFQKPQAR
jgi:hypothetical protein